MAVSIKNVAAGSSRCQPFTQRTVAAGFTRALLEFAVSKGACRKMLAERSEIDPAELQSPANRIAFEKYVALMRASKELCEDPALALHFGESPYAETSIGYVIGEFARNGAEGVALFNRYSRLNVEVECAGGDDRYVLCQNAGRTFVVDTRKNPNHFPELTEFSFTCTLRVLRRLWGDRQTIEAVHVTHAEPEYAAEYDRVFRVPVVFGSDRNALLLADDAWLMGTNPAASPYVFDILRADVETRLRRLQSSKTTRGLVEALLARILHTREGSMDVVARELGLSRQTLFRRLRAEGTSFEQVLDELRYKLALQYLGEKVSVTETAYLLGYSDRATFSRAFKRWTNFSPRALPRF